MSDITPIQSNSIQQYKSQSRQAPATSGVEKPQRGADSVDLSDRARLLSQLKELPDVREELIGRVRGEIAAGGYETDDKLDIAIDNLIADFAE